MRVLSNARKRSTMVYTLLLSPPSETRKDQAWGVYTAGVRETQAATRPTAPPLALCVWTREYLRLRIIFHKERVEERSLRGEMGGTRGSVKTVNPHSRRLFARSPGAQATSTEMPRSLNPSASNRT